MNVFQIYKNVQIPKKNQGEMNCMNLKKTKTRKVRTLLPKIDNYFPDSNNVAQQITYEDLFL